MASGDANDIALRIQRWLPSRWFPHGPGTRVWATITGFATLLATGFTQVTYAAAQSRIATATDGFLDVASSDYFGAGLPRRLNEPDAAYSYRIRREIIRPRNTRAAIIQAWQDLTGNTPTVFRPSNAADTGGIGPGMGMGIGVAGAYGSLALPFQAFVVGERGTAQGAGGSPQTAGPVAGIGTAYGGIGAGALFYGDGEPAQGAVTDAEVYAAIAGVCPAGHIFWVKITGALVDGTAPLDEFVLDVNVLE